MSEEAIRGHFRLMRELGFNCLKGIMVCPGTSRRQVMHWALDEGIMPWWYGEGGWEAITDELLDRLGIARDTPVERIRADQRFLAYQERLMRERVDRQAHERRDRPADARLRGMFSFDMELDEEGAKLVVAWLKETYGTVEELTRAWNMHHAGIPRPASIWRTWDEVEATVVENLDDRDYRRRRDIVRFKADLYLRLLCERARDSLERDPHAPVRAGGEMSLFLPFAARATDMEGIADVMADHGSFYPSIHLAWHFEESGFEYVPEVYLQSSLVQDWFKGGWCAGWETTGGPQQLSGGKGLAPGIEDTIAGFTVDGGVMAQLMLSYLAAGFKGFGLWCWSARSAGWEAGEYALLDRNNRVTDRARVAGAIGRAARRYRDELWGARKEPLVGVYTSFDNDALWAAISREGRDLFRYMGVRGRIGAGRALCMANVPWEHVTATDIAHDLAGRYAVIYLPTVIALDDATLARLTTFVAEGGRLVVDMPSLWYDDYGRLLDTGVGSPFEKLFGCTFDDGQYSSNVKRRLRGAVLEGFVCDLTATTARVVEAYDTGGPAITENALGDGTAVILGYEGSLACYRDRSRERATELVGDILGPLHSPYACEGAYVYRLAAPAADHYFLVNAEGAKAVTLDTKDFRYEGAIDVLSDKPIDPGAPLELPSHGGRWLRYAKRERG
jgi:beta-galactosidase